MPPYTPYGENNYLIYTSTIPHLSILPMSINNLFSISKDLWVRQSIFYTPITNILKVPLSYLLAMSSTRCSLVINRIWLSTFYVNYCDQPDLFILSSKKQLSNILDLELKDSTSTSTWACYRYGFGSRHRDDLAPFSSWDSIKKVFRYPTKHEGGYISKTYNATCWEIA